MHLIAFIDLTFQILISKILAIKLYISKTDDEQYPLMI